MSSMFAMVLLLSSFTASIIFRQPEKGRNTPKSGMFTNVTLWRLSSYENVSNVSKV